jgi:hypothetical protein
MSEDKKPDAPLPGGEDDELISEEEFMERMKDPAQQKILLELMRKTVAGEHGDVPPELLASAQLALDKQREQEALTLVTTKFHALMAVMERPGGTMVAEERLRLCQEAMEDLTNTLLETPEPHRTNYLKVVVPMREKLKAVRIPD